MKRMVVVAAVLAARVAAAQPGAVPPPGAPAATDARTVYEQGYQAMLRGDYAAARAAFATAAASTSDPVLRTLASEMARLAGDLGARSTAIASMPPPAKVVSEDDQPTGGRATFVTTTTLAAFYSGIVIDDVIDVDDVRTGTLIVMGTTAAGVLGSYFGTEGFRLTGAMADAWGLGMFVGAGNALLLSGPLGLYEADSNASEKVQTLTLASTWGGAAAGLALAAAVDPTRAQVSVVGTIGMLSLESTLLGFAIVQPSDLDGDTYLTITAAGLDAGLGIGAAFARTLDWSASRARYVSLGSFLGGLAGIGSSIVLSSDDPSDNTLRLGAAVTLAGLWAGFGVAAHLTRDMAPDLRYQRAAPSPQLSLSPTPVPHGAGLGVTGTF